MQKIMNARGRLLVVFSVVLLLKSMVAWYVVFNEGPGWGTVITEFPFFLIVFSLIEGFAAKRKMLYYMLSNFLMSLIYFAILMYYKYYGVIPTYHHLQQAQKITHVGESTYSLIAPYYLFVFLDVVLFIFFMFRSKYIAKWKQWGMQPLSKKALACTFSVSLGLCVFNVWSNQANMNEIKKAGSMGILNYEVYTLLAGAFDEEEMIDSKDITQQRIHSIKGVTMPTVSKHFGLDQGKNLIIVQLESFQNFLIGLTLDGHEITPNLNRLARENTYFHNFYANAGQGTTSDAEFVVNTSFYVPPNEPATSSDYMEKDLPSLPRLLNQYQYYTATFHTNRVDFWNRNDLYKAVGFKTYYDQAFFGKDDYIAFGSSDEVLYEKTLPELVRLDANSQPFYAMVISMSAHHPYHIPEEKYRMTLPEEYEGTLLGDYLRAQNYADDAMGQFLEGLKKSGLWDDSLLVFYGDHQGLPMYTLDRKEKELLKSLIGHKYDYVDMFNVPLIIHSPGGQLPKVMAGTGGQIDILPTVANLLGLPLKDQLYFGQDLFNQSSNLIPLRHFLPTGSFINDTSIYVTGNDYEDGSNYSLEDNRLIQNGSTKNQFEAGQLLLNLSNSYLLQLPNRDDSR